ncbi:MAG: SDR family NAD(P)-dependent oxidoreductase [Microthrixaceae bacterium]
MSRDLPDVAFVTGASRGIGRMVALHLARTGTPVVAVARPSADLDSLAEEAADTPLRTVPADVTDPPAVRDAYDDATDAVGPPTMVITCAGSIDALGSVADVDPDRWWSAVTVDLRGTMLTAQAAARSMLTLGRGRIITVYGNLGDQGTANLSAFAAAKAGVARFTETLANELLSTGVTVIGMHPGFVRTPMTERLAWSEDGRRWLPGFAPRAEKNWGDGQPAIQLLDQVIAGAADELAGRILHAGDDLAELARRAAEDDDLRRLRLHS